MPSIETQALVLETREYRETSMLATLLTPNQGRIGSVAKGARKGKTALAPILQPFSLLNVRLSVREPGGGLANLVAADLVERPAYACPGAMGDSLARIAYAGLFAEVLSTTGENDPHSDALFALARTLFSGLGKARHPGSFAVSGVFALIESLGYAPALDDVQDELTEEKNSPKTQARDAWVFDLLNGTLLRRSRSTSVAANALFPLSGESARALYATLDSLHAEPEPLSSDACIILSRRIGTELLRLGIRILETQLERPLHSERYLEEMVLRPS